MQHVNPEALIGALELKGDEEQPEAIVTKALADFNTAVEAKLADAEKKSADRLDRIEKALNKPNLGTGATDENTVEKKAFDLYLRGRATEEEKKALTVANNAAAGYLVTPEFGGEIIKQLREFSPLRQYAKVVTIGASEIRYPKRTGSTAATWIDNEDDTRAESGPTYTQITMTPGELATFVEISQKLLEDSSYDLQGEISSDLAESFAIAEGVAFVKGDGVKKPKGLLVATGIQEITSGAAAGFAATSPADVLIYMMAKLPTAHAQNGAWAMNRNTLATLRKFKDAQGNYLWQPGLQAGQPATLLGRPVVEMVDFPDVAAGTFPIVFGDFQGYRIVDRVDVSMLVDPYSRAKNGLVVMHARKRVGGDVVNPDRFVKLKIAA